RIRGIQRAHYLLGQFGRDPLVRIDGKDPSSGSQRERRLLLRSVAVELALRHASPRGARDLHRAIAGAGVEYHDLVRKAAHGRETIRDVPLLVACDQDGAEPGRQGMLPPSGWTDRPGDGDA